MATTVPKRGLVSAILEIFPHSDIRDALKIQDTTSLEQRLATFRKSDLEKFLRSSTLGRDQLQRLEERFPFDTARTFYLAKIENSIDSPSLDQIQAQANSLADRGIEAAHNFGSHAPVRSVYIDRPATVFDKPIVLDIPLIFEAKVEYRVADALADDYGELQTLYSLEYGFIWIINGHSHAVICCSGLPAVRAIIQYGRKNLGLRWWLPNLTSEIFDRLTDKGKPSSVTFAAFLENMPTISISARGLEESEIFQKLQHDPLRQRSAGFFRNPDGSILLSFGISKRYARIWTPYKLSKAALLAAASDIIARTEVELGNEYRTGFDRYVAYYDNAPVTIDQANLVGRDREIFKELVIALLKANASEQKETLIPYNLLQKLIKQQKRLKFDVASKFECANCGENLGRCGECLLPLKIADANDQLQLVCPNCKTKTHETTGFLCECGTVNEIADIRSHIQLYPEPPMLDAMREFLKAMDEVHFQGAFFIDGYVLRLLPQQSLRLPGKISLSDLRYWKNRAHYQMAMSLKPQTRNQFLRILTKTKEKCKRTHNYHPTHDLCQTCLNSRIMVSHVETDGELCLPRLMGLAIHEGFDGIHHGNEIADIKYVDALDDTGEIVRIGIHLKSRKASKSKGLGRSVDVIRALYTQVFYSAYQALKGDIEFEVIGISIPNTIKHDVELSIQNLLNKLGFSFLIVTENDWLNILKTVYEQLEFDANPKKLN